MRPDESEAVKLAPAGQQLHPTITTSEPWAVVRGIEHLDTYPHPPPELPSIAGGLEEEDEVLETVDVEVGAVEG